MNESKQIRQWVKSEDAARLIESLFAASQRADDIVDGDAHCLNDAVCELLIKCLIEIPANPAFLKYQGWLQPLIFNAVACWHASNVFKNSHDAEIQTYGWAWRDQLETIIAAIVYAESSAKDALSVMADVGIFFRQNEDAESVSDWVKS